MSKQVKLRGGTTIEHKKFIGAPREVTVDTDLKTLRVHDGETPGGNELATLTDVVRLEKRVNNKCQQSDRNNKPEGPKKLATAANHILRNNRKKQRNCCVQDFI